MTCGDMAIILCIRVAFLGSFILIVWWVDLFCLEKRSFQDTNITESLPLSEFSCLFITFSITSKFLGITYKTSKLQSQFLQLPFALPHFQDPLHMLFSSPERSFLLFMFNFASSYNSILVISHFWSFLWTLLHLSLLQRHFFTRVSNDIIVLLRVLNKIIVLMQLMQHWYLIGTKNW